MLITARPPTANVITARPPTANPVGGGCPLTFENGILNENRALCPDQPLLAYGTPWEDSEELIDGEEYND